MRIGKGVVLALSLAAASAVSAPAFAGHGGVVVVHGTGNYDGTQSCSGTGDGFSCSAGSSLTSYWTAGTVNTYRQRTDGSYRPYAVVGCKLANRAPWDNQAPVATDYSGAPAETGLNAGGRCVASQIARFLRGPDNVTGTADDITSVVVITHSGGINHVRYILAQYTANSDFTAVKNATKKVIAIAGPEKGTYLADKRFGADSTFASKLINGIVDIIGLYSDDGTNFIRTGTGYMATFNADAAKFGSSGLSNPVSGVTVRNGNGTYPDALVTSWSRVSCGNYLYTAALNLLHRTYLDTTDSATARQAGCSDGFISCPSATAMGQVFTSMRYMAHQQSKISCSGSSWFGGSWSGMEVYVKNEVNGTTGLEYVDNPDAGAFVDLMPSRWDTCGFSTAGYIGTHYTTGCAQTQLGNGWCDWDCFAAYGRDAVPTFNADHSAIISWGADDCLVGSGTTSLYTRNPYNAAFNGDANGDGYLDLYQSSLSGYALSYCPVDWINDGWCDACAIATYGSDGNDCNPGQITKCDGLTTNGANYVTGTAYMYNSPGSDYWYPAAPTCGNGMCEPGECTSCAGDCTGLCL